MDENEVDREIAEARRVYGAPPAPPAPMPPQHGLGQFNDLMQAMIGIETWKGQMLYNERKRENEIELRIRTQIEREMTSGVTQELDPGVKIALDFLVDVFKKQMHAEPPKMVPPIVPETTTTTPSVPVEAPVVFTQDDADKVADQIFLRFPDDVRAAQAGKISKEDSIAKIKMGGATEEQAAMIYQSILDTDFDAPEDVQK